MSSRPTTIRLPGEGHWVAWLGHKIRYVALGSETEDRYCLSDAEVLGGGGADPHRHSFAEGFYVLDGNVRFLLGSSTHDLSRGDYVHIPGGLTHRPEVTSEAAKLLNIATPAGFDRFQMEAGESLTDENSDGNLDPETVQRRIRSAAAGYEIEMDSSPQTDDSVAPHLCRSVDGEVVDAVGDRYRFLAEADQTGGRYALWHAEISPGGGPPPHRHSREDESFYVLEGNVQFEADGVRQVGGPGTFVNLPIGSVHRFENIGDKPAKMLVLVTPAGLETMFRRTGTLVRRPDDPIRPPDGDEIQRLHAISPEYGVELFDADEH